MNSSREILDTNTSTSQKFNFPDADIIIRSSDNVLFRIHKKNLEFATGGFPSADTPTLDEYISLTESSKTLEVLFKFIYPQRYPDLEDIAFEELFNLAEAAEKYEVYAAISVCMSRMKDFMHSDHSWAVLDFAARHDYYSLIVQLAPTFVDKPLEEIATILPHHIYVPWSIYRDRWLMVLGTAINTGVMSYYHYSCTTWCSYLRLVMEKLNGKPSFLVKEKLSAIFQDLRPVSLPRAPTCSTCTQNALAWETYIGQLVAGIPPFTLPSDLNEGNTLFSVL